jgi:hypothetical protein
LYASTWASGSTEQPVVIGSGGIPDWNDVDNNLSVDPSNIFPFGYRFASRDGSSWELVSGTGNVGIGFFDSVAATGHWGVFGQPTFLGGGSGDMLWLSSDGRENPRISVWQAASPSSRTLVNSWVEGTPDANLNPFGRGRYPSFWKEVNGVECGCYSPIYRAFSNLTYPPPDKSFIGKSEITPVKVSSVPDSLGQHKFEAPNLLGAEYGMVGGSMAYVAYASDGNFYYTRDPSSTAPLVKLARRTGVAPYGMPVYGNGWWIIQSAANNFTYYATKDLAGNDWFEHSFVTDPSQIGSLYLWAWGDPMMRTPLVFTPNKDPKLPGRFMSCGYLRGTEGQSPARILMFSE